MLQDRNSDFYIHYKSFVDNELLSAELPCIHESSTATILACTYMSGAAEVLAKHLSAEPDEIQAGLVRVLEHQLLMDASSCEHWQNTCQRLCIKYPLIKSVYEQGAVVMASWLEEPDKMSSGLLSLLGQHKNLGLLELELDGLNLSNTMSEHQRAEFNAQYNPTGHRKRPRRRVLLWILVSIAVVEIIFFGRYYGFW